LTKDGDFKLRMESNFGVQK